MKKKKKQTQTRQETLEFIDIALAKALSFIDRASIASNLAENTTPDVAIQQLEIALTAYGNARVELDKLPKIIRRSEEWKMWSDEVNRFLKSLPPRIKALKK